MSCTRTSSTPIQDLTPSTAMTTPSTASISVIRPNKHRRFPVVSRHDTLVSEFGSPTSDSLARRPRWTPQKVPVSATMTPDRMVFRKLDGELPVSAEKIPTSTTSATALPTELNGLRLIAVDSDFLQLTADNASFSEALVSSLRREKDLEAELTMLDSSFRAELTKWQRDRNEMESVIESLRREKAEVDAKLQAAENERGHLRSYIDRLPSSSEFEKLEFELKVKTLENERLTNSLKSYKSVNQKLNAKCDILTCDLEASRAQVLDVSAQLANEKSRVEELERIRFEAASATTGDDIGAILTENATLKAQHAALSNIVGSFEEVNAKLKDKLKAASEDQSKASSENEKLRLDLDEADRRVEFLRSQVTSRIAERDEERHTSAQLRQELFHARSSNDEVTAVSRSQFKLLVMLSRSIESLKTLLEADALIRKGDHPDTSKLLGNLSPLSSYAPANPEDFVGRSKELVRLEKDAEQLLAMIENLRVLVLNACADMVVDGIVC